MRIEPEHGSVSIVLIGDFNPAIYTPAWFALNEILPQDVVDSAKLEVAHPEFSSFSTKWLQLQVTHERFHAVTQSIPNIQVQKFVVRTHKVHLSHTPLRAVGINREVHFRVTNSIVLNKVCKMLAPTAPWGGIAEELKLDGNQNGMVSLTMTQFQPEGRPLGGKINVTVEPSVLIDNGRSGFYIRVNDHYQIDDKTNDSRTKLLKFLEDDFELSIQRADKIIDHVMSLAVN